MRLTDAELEYREKYAYLPSTQSELIEYIEKNYKLDPKKIKAAEDKVEAVTCKYREIKKDIAERTGNTEWFYDNIRNGNARENDKLFTIPKIFEADVNIEDYYRYLFNKK